LPWVKLILITVFIYQLAVSSLLGIETNSTLKRVLILYEEETTFGSDFPLVSALTELLGHFDLQSERIARLDWQPGLLRGYEYIIYVGTEKAELSVEMLEEMQNVSRILWFEDNIEQYAVLKHWPGFIYKDKQRQFVALEYKGIRMDFDRSLPVNVSAPGSKAEVLATIDNYSEKVPYAWRVDNLWYLGEFNYLIPQSAVLADLLHDFLAVDHPNNPQVLLRIEDVSPLTPPDQLARLVEALAEQNIPYAVGVIPTGNTSWGIITLEDVPQLVEVLRYVERTGGCILQCGYINETQNLSPNWVNQGMEVFAKAGIYPVALEAPDDIMSETAYWELAQHFSNLSGTIQMLDNRKSVTMTLPYIAHSTRMGMVVYPENLGYYNPGQLGSINRILDTAQQLTVLRDCAAGVFFHSYLPPSQLTELIKGLKGLRFEFIDLRTVPYWIETDPVSILSVTGHQQITARTPPIIKQGESGDGFLSSLLNFFSLSLMVIAFFFLLIVWNQIRNRYRLYEERQKETHAEL
jgi:uncharacterized protein YdaL